MTTPLTSKDIAEWHAKWQRVYAVGAYRTLGKWLFERKFMPRFLQGGRAEVEYEAAQAGGTILLFRERRRMFGEFRETSAMKPTVGESKELTMCGDLLIFPTDLEWTAFFHHEDSIPTYFARRDWMYLEA